MNTKAVLLTEDLAVNKIFDLAQLYQIETKRLKEAVRRNSNRFPSDFMFELTEAEFQCLRTQIASSNIERGGNRYSPMVFTEYSVLMLSSVLNSERAIDVNIQIMRVFSKMRYILSDNLELRVIIDEIRRKTENNTKNIEVVFQYLDELIEKQDNPLKSENK